MTVLRMTVLGSGSVGLAIAASYARAGQVVTVLARRMALALLSSIMNIRRLITRVADETVRAIQAERHFTLAPDGDTCIEKSLRPFVLPKLAAHRSSMLQDVEAGRRTEIDHLNGAVVRMGEGRGIATPSNDAVASPVRAREAVVPARPST